MQEKNWFIKTGDFFFKTRNFVFPIILVSLFVLFPPPAEYLDDHSLEEKKDLFAGLLVFSGLAFRAATIGWAYIKRGGLNKEVYADTLVVSGFFGLCRNPLYVGNMLIYTGIFLFHGHPVVVVLGTGLYYFIYESIIAAEEYFLRNKFGAEYEEYCKSTPRWLPDFSHYKKSTEGMSFSVMRSVAKDYTTIFNAVLALAFIELIEHYKFHTPEEFVTSAQMSGIIIGALLIVTVTIKILKKKGFFKF